MTFLEALGNIGNRLNRAGIALERGGAQRLAAMDAQSQQQQMLQQLGNIATGQNIPAFRKAELQEANIPLQQEIKGNVQSALLNAPATQNYALQQLAQTAFAQPEPVAPIRLGAGDVLVDPRTGGQIAQSPISQKPPLVNVSTGTLESAEQKALGKGRGEARIGFENKIDEAADTGMKIKNYLPILRDSLAQSGEGGTFKSWQVAGKSFINLLGADIDENKLANEEKFISTIKSLVAPSIKALGANPSNADRDFIESSFANINKSKASNKMLLDLQEAVAEKALERQRVKDDIAARGGSNIELRKALAEYDKQNTLESKYDEIRKATASEPMGNEQQLPPAAGYPEGTQLLDKETGIKYIIRNGNWSAS